MHDILNIIKYYFLFEYDEDNITLHHFISHLKFFAQRILNGNFISSQDVSLYQIVQEKNKDSYLCTKRINQHLAQQYEHPLTEEESLYLIIHVKRLRVELLHKNKLLPDTI